MAFNKTHFSNLRTVLNGYKRDINEVVKSAFIDEGLRKVYSEEHFKQMQEKQWNTAKKEMESKREYAQSKINSIIQSLRRDISDWANADVDQGLLNKLQAVKTLGAKLSQTELELFAQQSAGKYMETKILSGIAAENGFTLNAPSAESYLREISEIEGGCNSLLKMYCGPNLEGITMLSNNIIDGVDYGKYAIWQCGSADYILKPDSVLNTAESRWGDSMIHIEKKSFLTDEETEKINKLYDGHESNAVDRTKDILNIDPSLKELIALSQYSEFLPPEE